MQTGSSAGKFARGLAVLAATASAIGLASSAAAYIGDSFLSIPGSQGHWRDKEHKDWVRVETSDWDGRIMTLNSGATDPLAGDKLYFGGPNAVHPGRGGGKLIVALGVDNPDVQLLARLCADKTVVPEMTYSESSDRARPVLELGARPKQFPAWWRYTLKSVQVVDCPVLEGAAQRAFVLKFNDIAWLNYDANAPRANRIVVKPEELPPVAPRLPEGRKTVRSWLITWFAPATTTTDEQCPQMNGKPTEADVYKYLDPAEQAEVRRRFGSKGISYGFDSERRGPHRLNSVMFPGIVPDPGLHEPVTIVADGLDLDGNDGTGRPPRGIRPHTNFTAPDGRKGIDNELMRVMGCVPGFRGRRGYSNQTPNARRADGNITTLIEVSDIDDERNDNHVEVALIHSMDKPMRDTLGKTFIPGYTFRPSTDPNFALYNVRVSGRIVNGVIETDPVDLLQFNPGQGALHEFYEARFRIEPRPDGTAKTLLGAYMRWDMLNYSSGYSEGLFGFRAESIYYGLRRHADGLWNPRSRQYDGISVAYEIDTVPAYLTPLSPTQLASGNASGEAGDTRTNR